MMRQKDNVVVVAMQHVSFGHYGGKCRHATLTSGHKRGFKKFSVLNYNAGMYPESSCGDCP